MVLIALSCFDIAALLVAPNAMPIVAAVPEYSIVVVKLS